MPLLGRHSRQDELDFRSLAGLAVEMDAATQTVRNDVVGDMKAEPGASPIAARREERLERIAPDLGTHAAAIVGKNNFHVVLPGRLHLDVDGTSLAVRKGVGNRVEKEVGQHQSVRSRKAVDREIGFALDLEGKVLLSQTRPKAPDDLFGQITEIENALI